jgi:phosphatidylserine decarboxylase
MSATDNASTLRLSDRLFALLQYLLPKQLLSKFIYRLMRIRQPWMRRQLIGMFLKGYDVNMSEAVQPDAFAYPTFNDFFTRALRPDARPVASEIDAVVSPVDGTVSQCGPIEADSIIQAKGRAYSLTQMMGGRERAQRYLGGSFVCIYLAPYNYHRIHMALTGTLRETIYIPGALFSVNAATARAVRGLFARNERVVCDFDNPPAGGMAIALVGALFVGSIETVYAGEINPPATRGGTVSIISRGVGQTLEKAAELGRFNMGSTIVLVFEPGKVQWDPKLKPLARVRMGERIGTIVAHG